MGIYVTHKKTRADTLPNQCCGISSWGGGNVVRIVERWKVEILTKEKDASQGADKSHLTRHILLYLGDLRLDAIGVENQETKS
jgi:hypothetical protein